RNPRLIYAYSTGWGDDGPYVEQRRPGHDLLARAAAGWLLPADPDQCPVVVGISSDYPAGLMLVIGILMALQARERTGQGQLVTTDLYSVALHANTWESSPSLNRSQVEDDGGIWATEAAIDKVFETEDGYIEFSPVFSADSLRDISVAMGLEDLSQDPRFGRVQDRLANKGALNAILAERFRQKTTADWIAALEPQGILCGEIKSFEQAVEDPQTAANEMVIETDVPSCGSLRLLGTPVRLHGTPGGHRTPPPRLGEHTEDILLDLGYAREQVARLRRDGVLG
ncbi:MAG: CoA transferase, partial [Anaerolineae bacterium]|nr:CoA transferase [Anaerolineae bacterium]